MLATDITLINTQHDYLVVFKLAYRHSILKFIGSSDKTILI